MKHRLNQLVRPFMPVGLLDLMARRKYAAEVQRLKNAPLVPDQDRTTISGEASGGRRKTALILFWSHEFGAVQSLAGFLHNALSLLQVEVTMLNVASQESLDALAAEDPRFDFAISVGSIPLSKRSMGKPAYEVFGEEFYFWVLDVAIYDLQNIWQAPQYLRAAQQSVRLKFLVVDRDYASLLEAVTSSEQTQYFPFGGNYGQLPPTRISDDRLKRLVIIGTIGSELTKVTASNLENLAEAKDTPEISQVQRRRFFDAIEAIGAKTNTAMVAKDVFGVGAEALLSPEWLPFLTRVDSYQKRRRRLLAVEAFAGFPVDFYGTGWDVHVKSCESFRFFDAMPYADVPALFSRYSGLINFNPNLDNGFNDRLTTALGYGCRVITDDNLAIADISAPPGTICTYDANNPVVSEHAASVLGASPVSNDEVLAFRSKNSWVATADRFLQSTV